jgi:hypothetical protein
MKRFRVFSLMAIVLLIMMCLSFTACDSGDTTPTTYTVRYKTFTWSSASNTARWGNLQDRRYLIVSLNDANFNYEKSQNFNNVSDNKWTVDDIAGQLQRWGFGSTEAKDAANRFVSYGHAELGVRFGSNFYMMLK